MTELNLQSLFESGAHFGHRTRYWSPNMAPYIFGERAGIHIIDLDKTLEMYTEARHFLSDLYAQGNKILFVGTKRSARDAILRASAALKMPYVTNRWLGGTLTNYKTIRQSIRRLEELEQQRENGVFDKLTKKEALMRSRKIDKLELAIGGIRTMGGLPDALLVIDVDFEHIAIAEANRLGIPVIGIVDTNSEPEGVDFIVPANDDSLKTNGLLLTDLTAHCLSARNSLQQTTATSAAPASTPKSAPKSEPKSEPEAEAVSAPASAPEAAKES